MPESDGAGSSPDLSSWRLAGFGLLLAWVMTGGALAYTALSVLSVHIIDEFEMSRSRFGLLAASLSLAGVVSAPAIGRMADRRGGMFTLRILLGGMAVGFVLVAVSPVFTILVIAVMVAGAASTSGNPTTNNLIASHIPDGRRGPMVGIRHSGGQVGVLLGSLFLPGIALDLGWRPAIAMLAVVPLSGIAISRLARPGPEIDHVTVEPYDLQPRRWPLVVNAALMGFGSSAVVAFLPLFGQERLDMDLAQAGVMLGVTAGFAVVARLGWGWLGDRFKRPTTSLQLIAWISVAATVGMAGSEGMGVGVLWLSAGIAGVGMMAWHAAGMLAVLAGTDSRNSGRATASVHVGFLTGWTAGPVVFGAVVDAGSYNTAWRMLAVVFLLAALVVAEKFVRARDINQRKEKQHVTRLSCNN